MDLLKIISNYLLLGLGLLAFLAIWVFSILAVSAGVNRRSLPRQERWFWLALVTVLPLVGYAVYLFSGLARLVVNSDSRSDAPVRRDPTAAHTPSGLPAFEPVSPSDTVAAAGETSPPGQPVSPAAARCYLTVVDGPAAGVQFVLNQFPLRIGRGDDAQIRLEADQRISRRHAELYLQGTDVYIRDLGSMHGTSVNGAVITSRSLHSGDRITLGDTVLQFLCQ